MKIAVFSDTHLGFDERGERSDESFQNLEQAILLSIENNADFIIVCGDVFDAPVPSHNVLFRAMKAFSAAKKGKSSVKLSLEKDSNATPLSFEGIPIIAIHGNHEYFGKDTRTALDVLSLSHFLIYFHAAKIVAQKDGEKAAIFGFGAVPEKKALEVLKHWNPLAQKDATNILMLHQGFKEFMAIDDEMVATLSLDDLPKGFDLIVDGHLHWRIEQKLSASTFLLAGSTVATSIKKLEAEKPKGVYFFDTSSKSLSFTPFRSQRRAFYHKIIFNDAGLEEVVKKCREAVSLDLKDKLEMKPLIRVNLKGTLKQGLSPSDVNLKEIFDEFSPHAFLSISRNFLDVAFKRKLGELRELQKSKLSVAALGFELLERNLQETKFDGISAKELFDLLAQDDVDSALELVLRRGQLP